MFVTNVFALDKHQLAAVVEYCQVALYASAGCGGAGGAAEGRGSGRGCSCPQNVQLLLASCHIAATSPSIFHVSRTLLETIIITGLRSLSMAFVLLVPCATCFFVSAGMLCIKHIGSYMRYNIAC